MVHPSCTAGCTVSVLLSWPKLPAAPVAVPVHPTANMQAAVMQQARTLGQGSTVPVLEEDSALRVDISIDSPASSTGALLQFLLIWPSLACSNQEDAIQDFLSHVPVL